MANWNKTIKEMTNNKRTDTNAGALPVGYVIKKEPKSNRRSFALQQSILDALAEIAEEKSTSVNSLVNDILLEYVNAYQKED